MMLIMSKKAKKGSFITYENQISLLSSHAYLNTFLFQVGTFYLSGYPNADFIFVVVAS